MQFVCSIIAVILACGLASGCGASPREARSMQALLAARQQDDVLRSSQAQGLMNRLVENARRKQDRLPPPTTQATVDILIISGGGDWGAFGAGVLKGWGTVRGDVARPKFDVVTGVSTGALIAPFAFIGDDAAIEQIVHLYRNPQKDWAKSRGRFYFLPHNPSFFSLPGLERDVRKAVDLPLLERIVAEGDAGRELILNTTNVDYGDIHPWDAVEASRVSISAKDPAFVNRLMLTSAGVPGFFPAREIGDSLYVDGAITSNILYGGQTAEKDSFWATWQRQHPASPMPKLRYWVIFNNQFRFPPQVTQQRWPDIIGRSTVMATQSATVNAIRHLFAIAELAHLKRGADVEVRVLAVPDDWVPPESGAFLKTVMNDLADIGERMGADPASWQTESP